MEANKMLFWKTHSKAAIKKAFNASYLPTKVSRNGAAFSV
jgi:hypothetical protein